ncbi:hypothetical protein H7H73_30815, partial [Mycobacterium rufum]|nr:hypothetical protein [Mycolicibacterium rufum]
GAHHDLGRQLRRRIGGLTAAEQVDDPVFAVDEPLAGLGDGARALELTSAVVFNSTGGQCSSRTTPDRS